MSWWREGPGLPLRAAGDARVRVCLTALLLLTRQKEKKEKKSKRHDKARKRKPQTDESEQSEEECSSPKLKKAKTGGKQNGHVREESPENARLSSVSAKSTHKKRHSNSSETSSGDGDSDQEQVMAVPGVPVVTRGALSTRITVSLHLEQVIFISSCVPSQSVGRQPCLSKTESCLVVLAGSYLQTVGIVRVLKF